MLLTHKHPATVNRLNAATKFTRNHMEFAGIVVYFVGLAIVFTITVIVMMTFA